MASRTDNKRTVAGEVTPGVTAGAGAHEDAKVFRPSPIGWAARASFLLVVFGGLLVLPLILPGYRTFQYSYALIFAIVGLSVNVLSGYAGQISLGHQAFVGVGAFVSGNLVSEQHLSFWLALPLAAVSGGVAAGLLGLVALRLRGLYLALVTLAYGAVATASIFEIKSLTRGGAGMPAPRPAGFTSDRAYTYLVLGVFALVLWVDWRLVRSKVGRALFALRENEQVAASFGIDVTLYKVLAFVLSGFFAGVAGSLFAHWRTTVVASDFDFILALTFVLMAVVGGLGSRAGVVIGSAFFALLPVLLGTVTVKPFGLLALWVTAFGAALLLITLRFYPGGVGQQIQPLVRWASGGRLGLNSRAPAESAGGGSGVS
ncbi:MAG: branched-chain amino acid ABC transporter permease [Actinomycetota bacterium]